MPFSIGTEKFETIQIHHEEFVIEISLSERNLNVFVDRVLAGERLRPGGYVLGTSALIFERK